MLLPTWAIDVPQRPTSYISDPQPSQARGWQKLDSALSSDMVLPQPLGCPCGLADPSLPPGYQHGVSLLVWLWLSFLRLLPLRDLFRKMADSSPPFLWASEKAWLVSL